MATCDHLRLFSIKAGLCEMYLGVKLGVKRCTFSHFFQTRFGSEGSFSLQLGSLCKLHDLINEFLLG